MSSFASNLEDAINEAIQKAVTSYMKDVDLSDDIQKAVENYDFSNDIGEAAKNYDFSEALDEAARSHDFDESIGEAVENYDFSEDIEKAFKNYYKLEEDVQEVANDYLTSKAFARRLDDMVSDHVERELNIRENEQAELNWFGRLVRKLTTM